MYHHPSFLQFSILSEQPGLVHFQTTRSGGFSTGHLSGLNMGYSVGDLPDIVTRNRRLAADFAGVPLDRFVLGKQTHGTNIAVVDEHHAGLGALDAPSEIPDTDGLICATENLLIGIKTADCIPLLLYDPVQRVVAALHGGWKGTAGKIAPKAVSLMRERFNCRPEHLLAAIGAGAGPCCYEVGEEVFRQLAASVERYPSYEDSGRRIDLKELHRLQLIEAGVPTSRIEVCPLCSICHPDQIYSHRASQGKTGRSLTAIALKPIS